MTYAKNKIKYAISKWHTILDAMEWPARFFLSDDLLESASASKYKINYYLKQTTSTKKEAILENRNIHIVKEEGEGNQQLNEACVKPL